MNAESLDVTADVWSGWENQLVNGVLPLRRFLGRSGHSAVFLTEYGPENLPNAAIKIVPASAVQSQALLQQWARAATVSHPHLLRIFAVGRCQLGGRGFVYLVMEYAEQTLAQVLAQRSLSAEEARELVLPTLDALGFLHRGSLVHGRLQPANFLVVGDQLKLAGDSIRPDGEPAAAATRSSVYDPPELKNGLACEAGDIWSLGVTLVEALTQCLPTPLDEQTDTAALIATLAPPFADVTRACLRREPVDRPTVFDLEAKFGLSPRHPVPAESNSGHDAPSSAATALAPIAAVAPGESPGPAVRSPKVFTVSAFGGSLIAVLVAFALWMGLRSYERQSGAGSAAPVSAQQEPQQSAAPSVPPPVATAPGEPDVALQAGSRIVPQAALPPTTRSGRPRMTAESSAGQSPPVDASPVSAAVLHREMPDIPRNIREKIRGHVRVGVRVLVDPSGRVVGEFLENPGPSRYFARLSREAAEKWEFVSTESRAPRVWLLRFGFSRSDTTVGVALAK